MKRATLNRFCVGFLLISGILVSDVYAEPDYVYKGAKSGLAAPPTERDVSPTATLLDGYIWLGNIVPGTAMLASSNVKLSDGTSVTQLDQLTAKAALVATNPLYVRATQPQNTSEYYRNIPVAGVLEINDTVELESAPTQIARNPSLVQLWGHVKLKQRGITTR